MQTAQSYDGAINGIKVVLMGPLAGVGDPISRVPYVRYSEHWRRYRDERQPVRAVAVFILSSPVRLATRYYGVAYGYPKGIDIVKIWAVASCKN
ncbi:PTS system mannose/fructose/sorbose family transporter subunit IID [Shigella flexneri]